MQSHHRTYPNSITTDTTARPHTTSASTRTPRERRQRPILTVFNRRRRSHRYVTETLPDARQGSVASLAG